MSEATVDLKRAQETQYLLIEEYNIKHMKAAGMI